MPSVIEKYIQLFSEKKNVNKKNLFYFIKKIKIISKNILRKSKNRLELEKAKIDLKKKYYKLGLYISNYFITKDNYNFQYDDKFKEFIKEIKSLKSYITSLSKNKIKL